MSLTRYGLREWLLITLICGAVGALGVWLGWWWLVIVAGVVWFGGVMFFRDPWRSLPANLAPGDMISPADGVVSKILQLEHHEAVDGPACVIRIFLSVLDVHVNRSPCDGTVVSIVHRPGRYLDARSEESAKVNESNLVVLRLLDGRPVGVRQVSGAIARRIVCPIAPGQQLARGQRFGMIKFGSTTELILPAEAVASVHVQERQRVTGGATVLATVKAASATPAESASAQPIRA
jgi:phosphatidylserine decarboxylase